jgi:hypothetical protein
MAIGATMILSAVARYYSTMAKPKVLPPGAVAPAIEALAKVYARYLLRMRSLGKAIGLSVGLLVAVTVLAIPLLHGGALWETRAGCLIALFTTVLATLSLLLGAKAEDWDRRGPGPLPLNDQLLYEAASERAGVAFRGYLYRAIALAAIGSAALTSMILLVIGQWNAPLQLASIGTNMVA